MYRKFHCGDKMILWPYYLHNGIPMLWHLFIESGSDLLTAEPGHPPNLHVDVTWLLCRHRIKGKSINYEHLRIYHKILWTIWTNLVWSLKTYFISWYIYILTKIVMSKFIAITVFADDLAPSGYRSSASGVIVRPHMLMGLVHIWIIWQHVSDSSLNLFHGSATSHFNMS